jgi:hypothetical protein
LVSGSQRQRRRGERGWGERGGLKNRRGMRRSPRRGPSVEPWTRCARGPGARPHHHRQVSDARGPACVRALPRSVQRPVGQARSVRTSHANSTRAPTQPRPRATPGPGAGSCDWRADLGGLLSLGVWRGGEGPAGAGTAHLGCFLPSWPCGLPRLARRRTRRGFELSYGAQRRRTCTWYGLYTPDS